MFTQKEKRRRGRPPGRTAEGDATRARLYDTAIALIAERGYEAATLREVAARAGVSPALLYRYFPSKRAIVLALYDALSDAFAREGAAMPGGRWQDRFVFALELSLRVLGPHRVTLRALAPVLVTDADGGVLAGSTAFSRSRVESVFVEAARSATDTPGGALAGSLGTVLYLVHLGVILWWLLDRSPGQRATTALVGLIRQTLPSVGLALHLRPVRTLIRGVDALVKEALVGDPPALIPPR